MTSLTEQSPAARDTFRLKLAVDTQAHMKGTDAHRRSFCAWPAEADFILSALETAQFDAADRRSVNRSVFRALGEMQLFSDRPGDKPWVSSHAADCRWVMAD
jgi:hypothetical protein